MPSSFANFSPVPSTRNRCRFPTNSPRAAVRAAFGSKSIFGPDPRLSPATARRAADHLASDKSRRLGFATEVRARPRVIPAIVATSNGNGPAQRPHVLFYGPLRCARPVRSARICGIRPPFEPARHRSRGRAKKIIVRAAGAEDDKGQFDDLCPRACRRLGSRWTGSLAAGRHHRQSKARRENRIRRTLCRFSEANKQDLHADFALVLRPPGMWGIGNHAPAITPPSLRGLGL